MALILKTHNGTDFYTHIPHPTVSIRVEPVHPDDVNEVFEFKHIWTISGVLVAGATSIQTQVAALHVAYDVGTLQSAQILDDVTPLETLPTDGGLKITSFEFPEGKGPEWATKREYKIVIEGLDHTSVVDSLGEYTYTIVYSTNQSGIQARTISGTLKDIKGKSSVAKYNTLKSNQSWSTWSGANLLTDSYSSNKDNTICNFTVLHQKYWLAYTPGVTNADISVEERVDSQGVRRYRASGWFEGTEGSCIAAINILMPGGVVILNNTITRKKYANRTLFSLEYVYKRNSDIIFLQENLSIQSSIPDFVFKRVLGGRPIKQFTSYTVARAIQTGVIKRLQQYPSAPAPHWSASFLKYKQLTKISPEQNISGNRAIYGLAYTYTFEFSSSPVW